MTISRKLALIGLISATMVPFGAMAQTSDQPYSPVGSTDAERELTQQEINELLARARNEGVDVNAADVDVRYLGGNEADADSVFCCSATEEQVTEEFTTEETTEYFDAVTQREIIQPIERTVVQPIERRIVNPRTETITEDTRFEEEVLPVIVEEDPVPALQEQTITEEEVQYREETSERFVDVITDRQVIQPVERTVVIPVERRIVRPRTEVIEAQPRYETIMEDTIVESDPVPAVNETIIPQVTVNEVTDVNEVFIDAVEQRDIIQPVQRTIVQPIERRILNPQSETITRDTIFEEEYLPVRVEEDAIPQTRENIVEQINERVVYEVQDVYVDQVDRRVIQPVVVTRVQPVTRRILNPQTETITAPTQFEEERLPLIVEDQPIPETRVNYIPQVEEIREERVNETSFDAVTSRTYIQPVVRTQVQPIEYVRVRAQSETVTNPVRYETMRAGLVSTGDPMPACACGTGSSGGSSFQGGMMPVSEAATSQPVGQTRDGRKFLTW